LKVSTGNGSGNLAVQAYVNLGDVVLYAKRQLPVVQGHVWIAQHADVTAADVSPGKVLVLRRETFPIAQEFRTWAPCDALGLDYAPTPGWDKPGNARGFLVEKPEIELFDSSSRERHAVWTLRRADFGSGILLFSDRRANGLAHVEFHAGIVFDGWVKSSDLKWLPAGETSDQYVPTPPVRSSQLKVQGTPRVVKTDKSVVLRLAPKADATALGQVEPGTELYVTDIVAGFASVLPKAMNLAPAAGGQFWVDRAELGL
jgi:hypothetical protein